jgi:hypothetical protein
MGPLSPGTQREVVKWVSPNDAASAQRERPISPRFRPRWSARPSERRVRGRATRWRGRDGEREQHTRVTWQLLIGPCVVVVAIIYFDCLE